MSGICATAYGFFLSGIFESLLIGIELGRIFNMILLLAGGLFINVNYVSWLKYISFFFYANESIAIYFWSELDSINCSTFSRNTCYQNGTTVLESMGYQTTYFDIYNNYFHQLILTIILHFIAFFGIRRNLRRIGFY
jgi:hypothetical protein